jgi:CMP-N,N'-diacetyllegionaminic acid synthase
MNVLGVILARAGSAGLANKHLRLLDGKPVIAFTFDHAESAKRLGMKVVSTDCPTIKQLARSRSLAVIDRPANLATSDASVQDVMLHALDSVESTTDFHADAVVVLYGNVPLRPPGVIDEAIDLLAQSGCDSVRSVCPVGKWNPAWMMNLDGDRAQSYVAGGGIHRRQDLPTVFLHEGGVVAVSRASMLRGRENPGDPHAFFGADRRAIVTQPGQTIEIDEIRDLYLAQAILNERRAGQERVA